MDTTVKLVYHGPALTGVGDLFKQFTEAVLTIELDGR
jgi:hypothetical protein